MGGAGIYQVNGAAPTNALAGTAPSVIVAANAARKGLVLTNISSSTVYIGINNTSTLNAGIVLLPNGGSFSMDDYVYSTEGISAVANSAGNVVAIQEFN